MANNLTTEEFIEKAKTIHGDKYDYSLVDYKTNKIKVKILCPVHGEFEQRPNAHLQGCMCHDCNGNKKINTEKFIEISKNIYNNKYDYSLVEYKTDKIKVKIICPIHGIFEQSPNVHYNHGCYDCSNDDRKFTTDEFINKSKKLHGDKYDYSLVNYEDIKTKVKIICPIHGIFEQTPLSNLKGHGCAMCNDSKGEIKVKNFLEKYKLKFERQKTFDNCKNQKLLPFDFYVSEYNACIEFDGKQHFVSIDYWGGEKSFELLKKRDEIKNLFCKNNNIKLIRIRYDENITKILEKELNL